MGVDERACQRQGCLSSNAAESTRACSSILSRREAPGPQCGNATLDRNNVNCEPVRGCRCVVATPYGLLLPHDQSLTCERGRFALTAGGDESRIYGESYVESTCCRHHLADDRRLDTRLRPATVSSRAVAPCAAHGR